MKLNKQDRSQRLLQKARKALDENQKDRARDFALQASQLNPKDEEVWLILAEVSEPGRCLEYLNKALEINPASRKARKGMHWVNHRLRTQRINQGAKRENEPGRSIQSGKRGSGFAAALTGKKHGWEIPLFASILLIGLLALSLAGFPSLSVQAAVQKDERPEGALVKPTLTPTFTPTPTQTPTPTATPQAEPAADTYYSAYTYHSWDIPEEASEGNRFWIEIDLTNQMLYAYRGDQLISGFLISSGTSSYKTVTGTFKIYAKYPKYTMAGPGYHLEDVPYSMFFYKGYAIHGTYWHNNFGTPMSHGCVNMHTGDAAWVYDNAPVGTYVFVHY